MSDLEAVPVAAERRQTDNAAECQAGEIARLLLQCCPDDAASFALAMHERAAWDFAGDRRDHWACVMALLKRSRATPD